MPHVLLIDFALPLGEMRRGHLVILLVEDDDNDIYFVRKATEAGGEGHVVHAVHDGEQAILYLKGESGYSDRTLFPLPNVVLTDIRMPGMNGFEFLSWLRHNSEYSVIPAIVYSSSRLEQDIHDAYRLGANSYISKPTSIIDMVELLRCLYNYWSRCERPRIGERAFRSRTDMTKGSLGDMTNPSFD